jgi:hypothetical protein
MSVDLEARSMAEGAKKGVSELYGMVGGIAADIAAVKRGNRNAQIVIGAMVTIATCAIGAITQVQVARLGAHSAEKADVRAESTVVESAKAIEARVTAKLDELRTEMEHQRRGQMHPMAREPDVVTAANAQSAHGRAN